MRSSEATFIMGFVGDSNMISRVARAASVRSMPSTSSIDSIECVMPYRERMRRIM
jgi:hypothetical protein